MFDTLMTSVKAFFKGELFQERNKVFAKMAIGVAIALASFFGVAYVAPVWIAALVGGFAGGVAQPILFKNLKYQ